LKKDALDVTLWRIRFGGGYGPVVRLRNDDAGDGDDARGPASGPCRG